MFNLDALRRTVLGTAAVTLAVGTVLASSTGAFAGEGAGGPSDFAQTAAAPVVNQGPTNAVLNNQGGNVANVNIPCPAPWQQGGLFGSNYNACSNAPVFQQVGPASGDLGGGEPSGHNNDFAQTAAAPVVNQSTTSAVLNNQGGNVANVNAPCIAPWNQGGAFGADWNACNNASVFQNEGPVTGAGAERTWSNGPTQFGQVAAAPVQNNAPTYAILNNQGGTIANVNAPCIAAWQQGGLFGSDYNACNNAPVFQNEGTVVGGLLGR